MTASSIQVTQGSGTRLATNSYTEGAVTVHDEKMILGENYLASYLLAPTAFVSTATANSHLLQIMAGASLRVRIRRIEMHQTAVATTATLMDTRIYRLNTAGTGGTSHVPATLDTTDVASGATAMTLPTAKGTEAGLVFLSRPYMLQTISASTQFVNPILVWDFDRPRSKPLTISAGTSNGIAIKNIDAVAAGTLFFNVWFDETSF